jgi:hypothetical protein
VFLHPVGSVGHVVHFGASGARKLGALFFMLGWDWHRFHKQCDGIRYIKLVSAFGRICESRIAFRRVREQNVVALFFCSGGPSTVSIKSVPGQVVPNLCFFIWWDLWNM